MRLLTPDAVIRGTVTGAVSFVTIPLGEDTVGSWSSLDLVDAEIAPLGEGPVASRRAGAFRAHGDRIVALLVDEGMDAPPLRPWARHEDPVPGVFHLGPFLLHGTMRRLNPAVMGRVMPVDDARLEPARPGDGSLVLRAPLALVNTRWLSGYEDAATD